MPIDPVALKSELQTDPKTLGYAVLTAKANDLAVAALLNAITGNGTGSIVRNDVQPKEILQSIAAVDFAAATALVIAKLQLFLSIGTLDMTLANVQANLKGIFSGASATTTNALIAICTRTGSRAEVLFGAGTVIAPSDVAGAR